MTAPQPATPDPVDDVSLSWGMSGSADRPAAAAPQTTAPPAPPRSTQAPGVLIRGLVDELHDTLPASWSSYLVQIAVAGAEYRTHAVAELPDGRLLPIEVSRHVLELAATHRHLTVGSAPWMWLQLTGQRGAEPQIVSYDGFVGAPPAHLLFPAETYRDDISTAEDLTQPLWLLAHLNNRGAQLRPATVAALASPAGTVDAGTELPPLELLWPRFAALAAIFAGLDADDGPRMNSAFGVFRGEAGGCTLTRLPGGRAVLSGGADHSALMTGAYRGQLPWPDFYRGAPSWVSNIVLDERALGGMLSFCYWFDGGRWSRAAVEGMPGWSMIDEITPGVPGVWTTASTASLVQATIGTVDDAVTEDQCDHYVRQVSDGIIRPDMLLADHGPRFTAAEALTVLDLAQSW